MSRASHISTETVAELRRVNPLVLPSSYSIRNSERHMVWRFANCGREERVFAASIFGGSYIWRRLVDMGGGVEEEILSEFGRSRWCSLCRRSSGDSICKTRSRWRLECRISRQSRHWTSRGLQWEQSRYQCGVPQDISRLDHSRSWHRSCGRSTRCDQMKRRTSIIEALRIDCAKICTK